MTTRVYAKPTDERVFLKDIAGQGVFIAADTQPFTRAYELYDRVLEREGLSPIKWKSPADPPNLGKRVRNDLVKRILGLTLRHPVFED